MKAGSVLFLTYWYPNKSNKSFGIFIKRHAHAALLHRPVVLLSLNIQKGAGLFTKSVDVFNDEQQMPTHQLTLSSKFNKLLYVLLPLHYIILKNYVRRHILKQHRIAAVHCNVVYPCGIVGRKLAKYLSCPYFITEHWTKIDKFFSRRLYKNAGKKAFDDAAAITVVSQQLADTVNQYTSNPAIKIIPNVVDGQEFYYDTLIKKNSTFTFIAAANWAQFKDPFYFLNALKDLHYEKAMGDFKVVLAGNGEQLDTVKKNNYPFLIEYPGNLNAAGLNKAFNQSHVFLHGSNFETFSVVIAEALVCGLPSVVSPVGIGPEVIHAGNGFVTNNTAADWKEKILRCYNTTYNYQLISEQLKNRFSEKAVGQLFGRLYNEL